MMTWILTAAAIAFVISASLTRRFCDPSSGLHLLDHPNERSLHSQPTPRSGGVAILFGFISAALLYMFMVGMPVSMWWMIAGLAIVAGLSFLDDWRGLSVAGRFLGHSIGAAAVVIGAGLALPPMFSELPVVHTWLNVSLSILFLVWMVNLYNFMDGMDGFAGGMAVIGFGTFAVFGLLAENLPFAALSLGLAGATSGFLLFNFPPARIFMGDVGSASLGLLAGGFILWGARADVLPLWAGILVFSPFIVDASVTLLGRILRGERFWLAHKTHYYQRLVLLGWGHRKTVLAEYALMLACAGSALWMVSKPLPVQLAMLAFWAFAYATLAALVRGLERRNTGERS